MPITELAYGATRKPMAPQVTPRSALLAAYALATRSLVLTQGVPGYEKSVLLGWALDGHPIFGPYNPDTGTAPPLCFYAPLPYAPDQLRSMLLRNSAMPLRPATPLCSYALSPVLMRRAVRVWLQRRAAMPHGAVRLGCPVLIWGTLLATKASW